MISKLKKIFEKKEDKEVEKYINPKGNKKLSKRKRKASYINNKTSVVKKDIIDNNRIDNWIKEQDKKEQLRSVNPKKIKFSKRIAGFFGSALVLTACTFMTQTKQSEKVEDNKIVDKTNNDNNIESNMQEAESETIVNSELDGPIAIGDMAILNENVSYYETASMIDSGVSVINNNYVDGSDYNVISAVAIIDENNNIRYVNYEEGFELYKVLGEIEYLGLSNYQIVLHYGPLAESQKSSEANQYQLGWSSIASMNKIKSKTTK